MAGEKITAKLTNAPGHNAIGGLKVVAENGWFAARPSGTENLYKIYAESFKDEAHLQSIVDEAQQIVRNALAGYCIWLFVIIIAVHSHRLRVCPRTLRAAMRG